MVKAKGVYSPSLKYPELGLYTRGCLLKTFGLTLTDITEVIFILILSHLPGLKIKDAGLHWEPVNFKAKLSQTFPVLSSTRHKSLRITNIPIFSCCQPVPKEAVGKSQPVILSAVPVIVSLITHQNRQQIDGCPTIHPPAPCPKPSTTHRINLVGIIIFIILLLFDLWFKN